MLLTELWQQRLVIADQHGSRFWRSLYADALLGRSPQRTGRLAAQSQETQNSADDAGEHDQYYRAGTCSHNEHANPLLEKAEHQTLAFVGEPL